MKKGNCKKEKMENGKKKKTHGKKISKKIL